jgi:hypothetical protein
VAATASCGCSVFRVVHFPSSTSAPSLSPARPERFTVKLPGDPVVSQSSKVFAFSLAHSLILNLTFSPVGTITPGVAGAPTHPALLTLMLLLLPFRRGSAPPQGPFLDPLQCDRRSGNSLGDPQSRSFPESRVKISRAFQL